MCLSWNAPEGNRKKRDLAITSLAIGNQLSCYRKKISFCLMILYKQIKLFCATLRFSGSWFQLIQGSTWPKVNIVSLESYAEICVLSKE